MFLSHNYLTSDLQPQEVQGCVLTPAGGVSPEVHVIRLHSAGSGLCGWEHAASWQKRVWLLDVAATQSKILFFPSSIFFSSLQVEVIVSLVPPVVKPKAQMVVLILSSSMPVNWAIIASGVQGHVSIHVRASSSLSSPSTCLEMSYILYV